MLSAYFTRHPQSVGETYAEHLGFACGTGLAMIAGGLACVVHGLLPSLFVRTGSRTISRLHERLSVRVTAAGLTSPAGSDVRG